MAANEQTGRRLALGALLVLAGCLTPVTEKETAGYHNPLDSKDGGPTDGGAQPDSGTQSPTYSKGTVLTRRPDLTAAVYDVALPDGGAPRTAIALGDVPNLCGAIQADGGGLGANWDVVQLRLAGDTPGAYPVATQLAPSGAIASFQFQSDAGAFGTANATSGTVQLNSVDPHNQQTIAGSYTLTFSGTDVLSGAFVATPCPSLTAPDSN